MELSGAIPATGTQRPLGVTLFTAYLAVFAGLLPAAAAVLIPTVAPEVHDLMGRPSALGGVLLGVGTAFAAAQAWRGSATGRTALLMLVAVHYLLVAWNNYSLVSAGVVQDGREPQLWGRVVRSALVVAVAVWYFLFSDGAKRFYGAGREA